MWSWSCEEEEEMKLRIGIASRVAFRSLRDTKTDTRVRSAKIAKLKPKIKRKVVRNAKIAKAADRSNEGLG